MTHQRIGVLVEMKVNDGDMEPFKKLVAAIASGVEGSEPTTRTYDWYLDEENATCVLHEWYPNSESAIAHLTSAALQAGLPKLFALCKPTAFRIFGAPSDKLSEVLTNFPVSGRLAPLAGFSR